MACIYYNQFKNIRKNILKMSVTFIVSEAIIMKDTNFLFEMSPNYEIIFKEDKIEGESASGGGTNPKWEAEHSLESQDKSGIVTFTFLNDSELLGEADIDFASLLAMGADGSGWIDMHDDAGKF